jgi:hypothetical protein
MGAAQAGGLGLSASQARRVVAMITAAELANGGLPRRRRGRPGAAAELAYQEQVAAFCALIQKIASTMDFRVGSRGWCYILEHHGLHKGDFDDAQKLITACRKNGMLPLDICAEDSARETIGIQELDDADVESEAESWVDHLLQHAHQNYTPFSFWRDLDVYVEMGVEKLDLRNLFEPVCREFFVPITNFKGWSDVNARAQMMERIAAHEDAGRRCVLLLCGDHDPGGLAITSTMRKNLADLSGAVGWTPENLVMISSSATASRGSITWRHRAASNSTIPIITTTTSATCRTTSLVSASVSARPTRWWLRPKSAANSAATPSCSMSQPRHRHGIGAGLRACANSCSGRSGGAWGVMIPNQPSRRSKSHVR